MKRWRWVLLLVSGEMLAQPNETFIFQYCRVWGLVKYYHADAATGKIDWDEIFLKQYTDFSAVRDTLAFNQFLLSLLREVSTPAVTASPADKAAIVSNQLYRLRNFAYLRDSTKYPLRPDFRWIADPVLSQPVQERLFSVLVSFQPIPHVNVNWAASSIVFAEKPYYTDSLVTVPYRLLALFRYWNVVQYFYPYRSLLDQSWEESLRQAIPDFTNATLPYLTAVSRLAARTQDRHTAVWEEDPPEPDSRGEASPARQETQEEEQEYVFPLEVTMAENQLVVHTLLGDSLPRKYGISLGDRVTAINGKGVAFWQDTLKRVLTYSRPEHFEAAFADHLNYLMDDSVHYTLQTAKGPVGVSLAKTEVSAKEYLQQHQQTTCTTFGEIGYVPIFYATNREERKAFKRLKQCKSIIFDMRGYPWNEYFEHFPYRLRSRNFAKAVKIDIPYRNKNRTVAGVYKFFGILDYHHLSPRSLLFRKYRQPIVAIIDEGVISAAETESLVLKANRADVVFIGRTTAAANGNVHSLSLPGGVTTRLAIVALSYPDGSPFQRVGIRPDVPVPPTIAGIRAGKDEILEKAIQYLRQLD